MKKGIGLFLALFLFWHPCYAADQWDTTDPAGTSNASDIDANVIANNEALDRLLIRYKRGMGVNYATAATVSVQIGEIAIPDSSDGTVRWRRVTAATSVGWSDIDTGAEASGTTYYVYATADTDITGVVFKISTSSSAPSGSTYYRKIGSFYNNSSSSIENVVSIGEDSDLADRTAIRASVNFDGSGTVAINKAFNVSSITDNGTGDYTVNFTTAFDDANYSIVGMAKETSGRLFVNIHETTGLTTSSARIRIRNPSAGSDADSDQVCVIAVSN